MAIKEIPRAFLYTCDHCGNSHQQDNAGGHYHESLPPNWGSVTVKTNFDERFATKTILLCRTCIAPFTDDLKVSMAEEGNNSE